MNIWINTFLTLHGYRIEAPVSSKEVNVLTQFEIPYKNPPEKLTQFWKCWLSKFLKFRQKPQNADSAISKILPIY